MFLGSAPRRPRKTFSYRGPYLFRPGRRKEFVDRARAVGAGTPSRRPRPQLLVLDQALELLQGTPYVAGDGRGGDAPADPAAQAGPLNDVSEAKLDAGAAAGGLPQPPPAAMVHARHRRPGEVARRVDLDHLDQATDLGRPLRNNMR